MGVAGGTRRGGRDPGRPRWQCIIPWHWTQATFLRTLHKMAAAHRCNECVWPQLPAAQAEGKREVSGIFPFCTHCCVGFSEDASGCAEMRLAQSELWRNAHIPSIQPGFILAALLRVVGASTHRHKAFHTSTLQLGSAKNRTLSQTIFIYLQICSTTLYTAVLAEPGT